jgi:hypothetical protein
MKRTQIQLPDPLFEKVKKIASRLDWSVAELIRRGTEYIVKCYETAAEDQDSTWQPPAPKKLGKFLASHDQWRDIANDPGQNIN